MIRDEAHSILGRCEVDTPRDEIVWAAGVVLCKQAFWFEHLPVFSDKGRLPGWAGSLPAGRSFNCERIGMHVLSSMLTGSPEVVPVVRFGEIGELVTLERIGADLHGRIVAAMRRQRAHTDPAVPLALRGSWDALMAESRALAEQVWARCRPGAPVQLDIFDLIGA